MSKYEALDPNPFKAYRDTAVSEAIEDARKSDAREFWYRHNESFLARSCPVCSCERSELLAPYLDLYSVVQCDRCCLVYVPKVPPVQVLDDYYQNAKSINLLNEFYLNRRSENTVSASRISLVSENIPDKNRPIRILEIGCGNGAFLKSIKGANPGKEIILYGIEPNKSAAEEARKNGVLISEDYLGSGESRDLVGGQQYDLILCLELIEHLIDPRSLFEGIYSALSQNGRFIITTPNIEGLGIACSDYNSYRLTAHAISPPMHLQGFSRVSLAYLAALTDFGIHSLDAKGSFDVYELVKYAANGSLPSELKDIFDSIFRKNPDWGPLCKSLQDVIRFLNASGSMTAVLKKEN